MAKKPISEILATMQNIKGWGLDDSEHEHFTFGLEQESKTPGKKCAFIQSTTEDIESETARNACGHLAQLCGVPNEFRGHRIRMTASVKSALADGAIGRLEFFAIGKWGWYCKWNGTFDNMSDRPIVGRTDWQEYSLVIDVPDESTSLRFALFQVGSGKMWLDNISFAVVDKSVPLTGLLEGPTNLTFDE